MHHVYFAVKLAWWRSRQFVTFLTIHPQQLRLQHVQHFARESSPSSPSPPKLLSPTVLGHVQFCSRLSTRPPQYWVTEIGVDSEFVVLINHSRAVLFRLQVVGVVNIETSKEEQRFSAQSSREFLFNVSNLLGSHCFSHHCNLSGWAIRAMHTYLYVHKTASLTPYASQSHLLSQKNTFINMEKLTQAWFSEKLKVFKPRWMCR